jgi:tetratricopeptide (TPR) repeat protein
LKGLISHLLGRRAAALEEIERALKMTRSAGDYLREGAILLARGFMRCESGDVARGREDFRKILDMSDRVPSARIVGRVAGLYGDILAGDFKAAEARMGEIDRVMPPASRKPPMVALLSNLEIMRRLALGQDTEAIRLAEAPQFHEVLNPYWSFSLHILLTQNLPATLDGVAQALARRGELDAALEEYRALMTVGPQTQNRRLINPLYHFRIAGIYEKKGATANAAEHYRTFLRLWKDADPGLPEPGQARKQLAALGR